MVQGTNLEVSVTNFVTVVLNTNSPGGGSSITSVFGEFTVRYKGLPLGGSDFVFDCHLAIQPMLNVVVADEDTTLIPLSDGV
jgi:hypothetical protein